MNYCIIFDNQTIGIEIPVEHSQHTLVASDYICKNFPQFSVVNEFGYRKLKEGVDYTSVASATKWGYNVLPL